MRLDPLFIQDLRHTIASGYYERNAPTRRDRKSLLEAIENAHAKGELPLLLEMAVALPDKGLLIPGKSWAAERMDVLAAARPAALSIWVEPRRHAGDLRWLARTCEGPVLCKDWIIDARQIVGGDAVLLKRSLLDYARADEHALMESAHEQGMEVVMEVCTPEQLQSAKNGEADIIAVNNHGPNGHAPSINTTLSLLAAHKTGRPVISMHGIETEEQVRALLAAGAMAVELGAEHTRKEGVLEHVNRLRRARMEKDAVRTESN